MSGALASAAGSEGVAGDTVRAPTTTVVAATAVARNALASDLRFVLEQAEVPDELVQKIAENGYTTLARFTLIAENRAELQEVVAEEWGYNIKGPNRLGFVTLVDAWRKAKAREDEALKVAAESRAAGVPAPLDRPAVRETRAAVETRYEAELSDRVAPSAPLVDMIHKMVEEGHVTFVALSEVAPETDEGDESHQVTFDAKGGLRLKRRRVDKKLPSNSEELRTRLRTWGLAFAYAAARHPQREWLADATPQVVMAYVDYLLGEDVIYMSSGGVQPTIAGVIDYDTAVRRRQAKLVNDGLSFGAALRQAWREPELRERHFVTPLLVRIAGAGGKQITNDRPDKPRQPPPTKPNAQPSDDPPYQKTKGGKGAKGKGKDGKGKGNPKKQPKTEDGPKWEKGGGYKTDADGRPICFAFNKDQCAGQCQRLHICRRCLGKHSATKCNSGR